MPESEYKADERNGRPNDTHDCGCGATVSETLATFNRDRRPRCPYCEGSL